MMTDLHFEEIMADYSGKCFGGETSLLYTTRAEIMVAWTKVVILEMVKIRLI